MAGMTLPLTPLAHQLARTGRVATPAGQTDEIVLPILRHQEHDLYYREDHDRLLIGYYGHQPMPVNVSAIPTTQTDGVIPSVLAFTPGDFEPAWAESKRLLPALADTDVADGFNGLFSFTTDSFPLIGESADVKGFCGLDRRWVAAMRPIALASRPESVGG
jgi:glycine/D-amino acid oxidase-like deaminating enzyme